MHYAAMHMGYRPTVRIAKTRRVATLDDCSLCVDDVEGIGGFLELEHLAPDDPDTHTVQAGLAASSALWESQPPAPTRHTTRWCTPLKDKPLAEIPHTPPPPPPTPPTPKTHTTPPQTGTPTPHLPPHPRVRSFHPGLPEATDPAMVYVETLAGDIYLEERSDVNRYTLAFDRLVAAARHLTTPCR